MLFAISLPSFSTYFTTTLSPLLIPFNCFSVALIWISFFSFSLFTVKVLPAVSTAVTSPVILLISSFLTSFLTTFSLAGGFQFLKIKFCAKLKSRFFKV
jgi:hypothetical protein